MISRPQIELYLRSLDDPAARVRYHSSRCLRRAARETPELLYPHFDRFAQLRVGDNTILRWNATWTIGHLAAADRKGKIDRMLRAFCAPITGPEMIGAANTIGAAAEIAIAKPHLAERIARKILRVEKGSYATPECRNVAIGHAIQALSRVAPLLRQRRAAMEFVTRQMQNPRPATRRKAERFLKRFGAINPRNEPAGRRRT